MKVRTIKECENTERDVNFKEGKSLRVVLAKDNMGFSIHKTIIPKGQKGHWHYKHHLESCYCIQGKGLLTVISDAYTQYVIEPDTVYSLDKHDEHIFEALEDVVLISVFNPPVTGDEIHQNDGSYKSNLAKDIVNTVNDCTNDYDAIDEVKELLKQN